MAFVGLSCSLFTLAQMFDLPPAVVHSTISKMIINEELQVSFNLCFVLHENAVLLNQLIKVELPQRKDEMANISSIRHSVE